MADRRPHRAAGRPCAPACASRRARAATKFGAIEVASSTAGRAVFFSGLAVMISLGGLLLIDDDVFKSIAIGSISVVLISVARQPHLPARDALDPRPLGRALRHPGPRPRSRRGPGHLGHDRPRRHQPAGHRRRRRPARSCSPSPLPVSKLQLGSTTSDVSHAAAQRRGRPRLGADLATSGRRAAS